MPKISRTDSLISCSDAMILCETIRLVSLGVCCKEKDVRKKWLILFEEGVEGPEGGSISAVLIEIVIGILRNTLNEVLLERTSALVNYLLFHSEGALLSLLEAGIVEAVLEVLSQKDMDRSPVT